ncbi:polyunsaturated fatty acid lipoxygenase ALOX15B-like [Amphiura filiformis]|uniref:polyunsaturated fatty acid lipoxygenase ALOX15B-like n=1 Tax=Amphiura filiformis TaxID=82378 RepID=UPI003B227939
MARIMASSSYSGAHTYTVKIKTGRYKGTKCLGNAILRFYSKDNPIPTERHCIGGHFDAGKTREVRVEVPHPIDDIEQLEVWLERPANTADVRWFVEHMQIEDADKNCVRFFPFHRWVTMKHQIVRVNNALLPQHDPNEQRRNESIHLDKEYYFFSTRVAKAVPIMSEVTASPESFTKSYFMQVFILPTIKDTINQKLLHSFSKRWDSLTDTGNIYERALMNFARPEIVDVYMDIIPQDDWSRLDKVFADQRLIGTNPAVIQRVHSLDILKEIMDVSDEDRFNRQMKMALSDAVEKKKLFMVDYTTILRRIICQNGTIASPVALFYVNEEDDLMPVAIQLFKNKGPAGPDNPVFFPDDNKYTWMLAKIWFNNADASYHQSVSHLGFTHLVMETIYLALRQTVSISHPLYHLMAPHFLYLLKVNETAFKALVNPGGWVDTSMSIGVKGMYEIIRRRYQGYSVALDDDDKHVDEPDAVSCVEDLHLAQAWRLDREGNLENDIKCRGVEDLPKYYFRDDALAVYRAIKKYVSNVVNPHYADIETLKNDYEIQEWASMLSAKYEEGGCQIQGVPGRGQFSDCDQLIDTITSVIYISSVAHASVNFLQYEQYGYPFNYPAMLYGDPPRTKNEHAASDILQCLPTKKTTLGSLAITDLLSQRATKKLGDFEIKYQFDKIGMDALKQFQEDLQEIQDDCDKDTKKEEVYDILNQNISQMPSAFELSLRCNTGFLKGLYLDNVR